MDWAPWARIAARYIIGGIAMKLGDDVLADPEIENLLALALAGAAAGVTEWLYKKAKARGWAT